LKPIHRRVWAPIGERPIALSHHRYEWLYVTAFVAPASGETVWFLSNGIDKPFFAKLLEAFARDTGAGRDRIIVLQLDNAGWHTPKTCRSRTASGSSTSQPTPRNCSRPNTSGRSSTSRSSTSTSKPSMISTPSSLCDAEI
jgi:hypothetical protein